MKVWRVRERTLFKLCLVLVLVASVLIVPHTRFYSQGFMPMARITIGGLTEKIHFSFIKEEVSKYDTEYVLEYIELTEKIENLEEQTAQLMALGQEYHEIEAEAAKLEEKREEVRPYAEAVVEKQIAHVAEAKGLTFLSTVAPRPLIQFTEAPHRLIISPRDRIERRAGWLILEASLYDLEQLENEAEEDYSNSSAYAVQLGGISTYPAQINHRSNLRSLLRVSAHEWIHHYLFVATPLGRRVSAPDHRMRIINESVTVIGDEEMGNAIYRYFYEDNENEEHEYRLAGAIAAKDRCTGCTCPTCMRLMLANASTGDKEETEEVASFGSFMAETRKAVDELLEKGKIEEAEEYMQNRQEILVENGYNIRKINQAYFAFHGAYAARDHVPDPIGDGLRELRSKASSLAEFYKIIGKAKTYEDFKEIMHEYGIEYDA